MSLVMAISDGNIIVVMPPTVTCHTPRSVDGSRGAAHRAELQDPKPWCVLFCVESSARGLWQSVHFCFIRSLFWSYLLAIIKCSICSSRLMVPRCAAATRIATARRPCEPSWSAATACYLCQRGCRDPLATTTAHCHCTSDGHRPWPPDAWTTIFHFDMYFTKLDQRLPR